ncbi:MAG: hypothetical protein LBV43_08405 [Prevotella sp.]|jgi:hypothetical protein|nr:hypothetical protein [Prevotella sp.]
MNWTTELPFNLNGVEGDLKIVYNPLSQKFYQNNIEIKKSGSGFGGLKYKVGTTDGGDDIVKVKAALLPGRQVIFRGMTTNLEERLGGLSLLLSVLPFIFIAFVTIIVPGFRLGVIGGAFLVGCGALGMLAVGNSLRNTTNFGQQIMYTIILSVATTALFVVLCLIWDLIFGGAMFMLFR